MKPDYTDALRSIGLFLDLQQAVNAAVIAENSQWSLAWDGSPRLLLEPSQLDALRSVARLHRGLPTRHARPERLRAIGALFDRLRASTFSVVEGADGYRVTARVGTQEGARTYRIDELEVLANQYRSRRGTPAA